MFGNLFRGRYGLDVIGLILLIISVIFLRIRNLWIVGIIIIGYALYRAFSTNIAGRRHEQQKFNQVMGNLSGVFKPLGSKIGKYRMMSKQKKNYVFVTCPKCKKTLRLPRNMGKLQVTCPVCKDQFLKKT